MIVYLNGQFIEAEKAWVSPFDRGFLFAEALYEAIPLENQMPFQAQQHLLRLNEGLREIGIPLPLSIDQWLEVINQLIMLNRQVVDPIPLLSVYIQVSRGMSFKRSHLPPAITSSPTVFAFAHRAKPPDRDRYQQGFSALTLNDMRHHYAHLKSTNLMANTLALQCAVQQGYDEAIFVDQEHVVESVSSNVFIIKNLTLHTPACSHLTFNGVTRMQVIAIAKQHGYVVVEGDISIAQLMTADEVWLTGSTKEIMPIVRVNQTNIGTGRAGEIWQAIYPLFRHHKITVCQNHLSQAALASGQTVLAS